MNEFICVSISSTFDRNNCGIFSFPIQHFVVVWFLMKSKSFVFFTIMFGEVTPKWVEVVKRTGSGERGESNRRMEKLAY